jgi:hypothetical protein
MDVVKDNCREWKRLKIPSQKHGGEGTDYRRECQSSIKRVALRVL